MVAALVLDKVELRLSCDFGVATEVLSSFSCNIVDGRCRFEGEVSLSSKSSGSSNAMASMCCCSLDKLA